MKRRTFLTLSSALPVGLSVFPSDLFGKEAQADFIVVGGGLGGCAAALGALRNGLKVIMTEETEWIGGQITQQGVPPDENSWIEDFGCTDTYLEFRRRVREYYLENYPVLNAEKQNRFNPGACGVSRICHEPKVALNILESMLAPYLSNKQLTLLTNHKPVATETNSNRMQSVTLQNTLNGNQISLYASYFADATETGELLPLSNTEFVTGAEAKSDTGELHAADQAEPNNMQAVTWCFAMDYLAGEDHTIDKPQEYDFWRNYTPKLEPDWPGKLFAWTYSHPHTLKPRTLYCDPVKEAQGEYSGFWRYRRMIAQNLYDPSFYQGDICLVNWPQNDYFLGNIFGGSETENQKHLEAAKQLSLSLLYWLQTEAPHMEGNQQGWKGLRLRGDLLGTEHGLAKRPYIRESQRIVPEFRILEQHVGTEMRKEELGDVKLLKAAEFYDSVGIGYYRIDLHPSTGGDNYIDIGCLPFQIPLGAMIPINMDNLLPACKNIGTTHITNGSYRLHPVEWNIGESVGCLVAYCLKRDEKPRAIRNQEKLLTDFQDFIKKQGVRTKWPESIHE